MKKKIKVIFQILFVLTILLLFFSMNYIIEEPYKYISVNSEESSNTDDSSNEENKEKSYIKWVEFNITFEALDKAAKLKSLVDKERRLKFMYAVLFHDIGKVKEAVSDLRHDAAGIMIIDDVLNRFTNEKDLHHYVKDMIAFHMRPLVLFENRSSDKKIIRMLDASVYPKDLLVLSEVDIRGRDMAEAKNKGDLFHKWANKVYRMYMEFVRAEHVNGYDLIKIGLHGKNVGIALKRARYLEAGISSKRVVLDTIKREFGIKEH